jgi:hypothetical protein
MTERVTTRSPRFTHHRNDLHRAPQRHMGTATRMAARMRVLFATSPSELLESPSELSASPSELSASPSEL